MFDAALKRAGSLASKQFLGFVLHEGEVHLSRIVGVDFLDDLDLLKRNSVGRGGSRIVGVDFLDDLDLLKRNSVSSVFCFMFISAQTCNAKVFSSY